MLDVVKPIVWFAIALHGHFFKTVFVRLTNS